MKLIKNLYCSAVSFITKRVPVVVNKPKVTLTVLCSIVLPVVALLAGVAMLLEEKRSQ